MLYKVLPILLLSINAFAGPACNWKPVNTDTTKSNGYLFQVVTLDCNIDYYKNDNVTTQELVILDSDNNNTLVNDIGYADKVSIVTTPEGFPHQVILSSIYGNSNISHTYHIYSTSPVLKLIGKVIQPVNKYQASNGNGSEREVVGFYKDKGMFLIDRMTTKGTKLGKCNACQNWNVETLALGINSLVPVDLKPYSFNKYKPFEMNEHYAKGLFLHSQNERQEAIEAFNKASKEGVIAADLWIAVMSASDIDYEQSKDVINARLQEMILKFDKVQQGAPHPSMVDTAADYIKMIKDNLIK